MSDPNGCRVRFRRADGVFEDVALRQVRVEDLRTCRPVREFRSVRGQRHYSGWYWSATVGHHVVYESRLELARLLVADQDRRLCGIVGQPLLLQGRDETKLRRHVPDFLLFRADGSVLVVDVKPSDWLDDPKVTAQFAWTRRLCADIGWDFEVWSGSDPTVIANLRFLAGFRRPALIDEVVCAQVVAFVSGSERIEVVEDEIFNLLDARLSKACIRAGVLHLMWRGDLLADLSAALSGRTEVWPRETGESDGRRGGGDRVG